jgi:hypothetical protein
MMSLSLGNDGGGSGMEVLEESLRFLIEFGVDLGCFAAGSSSGGSRSARFAMTFVEIQRKG